MKKTAKEQILEKIDIIEKLLCKSYDIIIKQNKEGLVKIMYYEPKNIKGDYKCD